MDVTAAHLPPRKLYEEVSATRLPPRKLYDDLLHVPLLVILAQTCPAVVLLATPPLLVSSPRKLYEDVPMGGAVFLPPCFLLSSPHKLYEDVPALGWCVASAVAVS
ncbi:hypothetical protein M407DRAFT_35075 [Tulasnella calospora MUT 4182]|uniref:Uncharacterized protein n=1 Tax=Tulasnella calospora MUT 4182 TaxID=1051891 RepID=A0A0C3PZN2_9AGAM|nr:hypothetical protein M407DRAFT_35075 [Tulasnella calospora MUT 4182]